MTVPGSPPAGPPTAPRDETAVAVFAPALVLFVELHRNTDDDDEVHLHAGGQGDWISHMIKALGVQPIPCAAVGGESGNALRSIHSNSVVVDDRRGDDRTRLAESPIPKLGRHEVDKLYSATVGAAMAKGVCVLAGTQLAPMFDPDTFRQLVADLRRNGITVWSTCVAKR